MSDLQVLCYGKNIIYNSIMGASPGISGFSISFPSVFSLFSLESIAMTVSVGISSGSESSRRSLTLSFGLTSGTEFTHFQSLCWVHSYYFPYQA